MASKRFQFGLLDMALGIAVWSVAFNLVSATVDDVKAMYEAAARRSQVMPGLRGNHPFWETPEGRRMLERHREWSSPEATARRKQWEQARRLRSNVALATAFFSIAAFFCVAAFRWARAKASRRLEGQKASQQNQQVALGKKGESRRLVVRSPSASPRSISPNGL